MLKSQPEQSGDDAIAANASGTTTDEAIAARAYARVAKRIAALLVRYADRLQSYEVEAMKRDNAARLWAMVGSLLRAEEGLKCSLRFLSWISDTLLTSEGKSHE